jgi:NAD(P)-dependent dehydrogenase (short-subunit alcohol dehydrogenase family)
MGMSDDTRAPRMIDLATRRAIVTGAASGFGAAITRRLIAAGADVLATDVAAAGLERLAGEIASSRLGTARLDVGDAGAWQSVVDEHGPFDIAILNAGVATNHIRPPGSLPVLGLDAERYRTVMAANVDGVVFGTQAVLGHMSRIGFGDIVVTASIAGIVPIAPDPVYGLSKHAAIGFVRSMADAIAGHHEPLDISISAVCPGFADTAILSDDQKSGLRSLGFDLLTAEDVADTMIRALAERRNGAQWVVAAGVEEHCHQPKPIAGFPFGAGD